MRSAHGQTRRCWRSRCSSGTASLSCRVDSAVLRPGLRHALSLPRSACGAARPPRPLMFSRASAALSGRPPRRFATRSKSTTIVGSSEPQPRLERRLPKNAVLKTWTLARHWPPGNLRCGLRLPSGSPGAASCLRRCFQVLDEARKPTCAGRAGRTPVSDRHALAQPDWVRGRSESRRTIHAHSCGSVCVAGGAVKGREGGGGGVRQISLTVRVT